MVYVKLNNTNILLIIMALVLCSCSNEVPDYKFTDDCSDYNNEVNYLN